jgi:hypothetical protein
MCMPRSHRAHGGLLRQKRQALGIRFALEQARLALLKDAFRVRLRQIAPRFNTAIRADRTSVGRGRWTRSDDLRHAYDAPN